MNATGNPLAGGKPATSATAKVRVLRAFLLRTDRQEVGKVIEISTALATELVGLNKVERVVESEKAAPSAPTKAEPTKSPATAKKEP